MSSRKCFKEGCTNKPHGKCDCEGIILFCKKHFYKHAKEQPTKQHKCLELYFKPAEEIKQSIIDKLKELKNDIKICRADAIANAYKIINNFKTVFGKYIDQINDIEARCNKMIENLLSGEKFVDTATEDDMESVVKLNASDIQQKINGWNINECYLNYEEINATIKKIFKDPFNPCKQNQADVICLNELSFFRHTSKYFVTINLNTFQVSSTVTLPIEESIQGYAKSCILPDGTYFYCCNASSNSGYTFTIDKNKNVKRLQNSKVNYRVDPIFYNNFIYLIGGLNKLAERYDFKQNIWESMAPINQDLNFDYGCNILYRDLILITSYYIQKLIIYSIPNNNYQEVQNLVLNNNCYKLMLVGNNRVYVFEKGGRAFESAENNISSWNQIGTNNITGNLNQSSAVRYKGCFFFVICTNQFWKFDLNSKQASQVTTI